MDEVGPRITIAASFAVWKPFGKCVIAAEVQQNIGLLLDNKVVKVDTVVGCCRVKHIVKDHWYMNCRWARKQSMVGSTVQEIGVHGVYIGGVHRQPSLR